MMSSSADRAAFHRAFLAAPVYLVTLVLFALVIGGGGRDLRILMLAQSAVFVLCGFLAGAAGIGRFSVLLPLAAFFVAIVVSVPWSVRPDSSLRGLLLWGMYAGIFLLVASSLSERRAAQRLTDGIIVTGGWLCLVGLYLFWGAADPTMRWYSTFYAANAFAGFLLLVVPLAAARLVLARGRREAFDYGAVTVLLATALVLTYSRGAWLSLLAAAPLAIFAFTPFSWRQALVRVGIVAAVTALAVTLLTRTPERVLTRATSLLDSGNSSVQDRLSFWRSGLAIFADHPVVGTGLGTFAFAHARYQGRYYARDAHNFFVQTVAEMGLVGALALLVLLVSLARLWIRTLRRARGKEEHALIAGAGLSLAAFLLHSSVEMDWHFPANPAVAFALAGVLAWYDDFRRREVDGSTMRTPNHPAVSGATVLVMAAALLAAQALYASEQALARGATLVRARDWSAAAREFRKASLYNPFDPRVPSALATVAQRVDPGADDAETLVRRAMALDRMNAYYVLQLAEILSAERRPQAHDAQIESLYRRALELDPFHYPEAYRRLARMYRAQGRLDEAESLYRSAGALYATRPVASDLVLRIRLWPRVARLYAEWALFVAGQGRTDEAIRIFDTLLAQDPTWEPAYLGIARLQQRRGDLQGAYHALIAGLSEVPDSWILRHRLNRLPAVQPRVYPR